jgi:hypothetical protein
MNLENSLYFKIEFSIRGKRGILQPQYNCMSLPRFGEDNNFLGLGGINSGMFESSKQEETPWESARRLEQQYKEKPSSNPWSVLDNLAKKEDTCPTIKPWLPEETHKDFEGHSWGESFETDMYIKKTPLGMLHVHHTNNGLITGAKLFNESGEESKISNYDASMLDLFPGTIKKKKGAW